MSSTDALYDDALRYIGKLFSGDSSGHDVFHSVRVHNNAVRIAESEGGDMDIIRLAALLHDCDDRKLFDTVNHRNARAFMESHGIPPGIQDRVCHIIFQVSFRGTDSVVPDSLEGRIVQDADRLDAIGAIGIGRAFAYGGSKGRKMHDPSQKAKTDMDEGTYFSNEGTTINHFYEKLLLLKDMMNTQTGRKMAEERHRFMLDFLDEFYSEWDS